MSSRSSRRSGSGLNKRMVCIIPVVLVLLVLSSFFTNPARHYLIAYSNHYHCTTLSLYDNIDIATDTKITNAVAATTSTSTGTTKDTGCRDYKDGNAQDSSSATVMAMASGYGLDINRNLSALSERPASTS